MKYCLVINNEIIDGPTQLPKNSENVSNFNLLSDEELKIYGWLPYTLIDNQQENQVLVESRIEIFDNQVIETKIYREMTQLEIEDKIQKNLNRKWNLVRQKRNKLLKDSDWTQLSDSPVDKNSWANYRQELRDLPEIYTNPDLVIWPTLPLN